MDFETYMEETNKTKAPCVETVLSKEQTKNLFAVMEMMMSVTHNADLLKKHLFYKKPVEFSNSVKMITMLQESNQPLTLNEEQFDLLHAAIGLFTESGEIIQQMYSHLFSKKELDKINLSEELGDIQWYETILYHHLNTNPEKVRQQNIDKLRARYGEKFTTEKAVNRDLNKERDILENS